jgi:spore coat protein F
VTELENRPAHLAWHETMEMHELVVSQTIALKKFRLFSEAIKENTLQKLYVQTIGDLEKNLNDILAFYPDAPRQEQEVANLPFDDAFYAAELLACSKVLVKNYATAITETATPSLKDTFVSHLTKAIKLHTKIFNYMHQHGMYPAYHLEQLLENDVTLAKGAL